MPTIEAGQPVPDFTLPRDGGGMLGPKDFAGRKLVIYFYPKDDTPGCTTEALEFTARLRGVRGGEHGRRRHLQGQREEPRAFCKKHGLGIPLLSDETGEVLERFGVWGEKSMYGRTFMGIDRSTFLVDARGIVSRVWRKVSVPKPRRRGPGGGPGARLTVRKRSPRIAPAAARACGSRLS